ncbi:hypothetical protein PGT21_030743 [Puccinia graminis f. sp. tritici]|uniref:Uncharacterized protein n=1 Tax=Puccinia graminis f. sp. tritici TaxID=56615 RepID=A0A5B0LZ65_PUCGR|nr:hypothetical protein PGT21_030743 [Puccinia graminis f. sp. tritici]
MFSLPGNLVVFYGTLLVLIMETPVQASSPRLMKRMYQHNPAEHLDPHLFTKNADSSLVKSCVKNDGETSKGYDAKSKTNIEEIKGNFVPSHLDGGAVGVYKDMEKREVSYEYFLEILEELLNLYDLDGPKLSQSLKIYLRTCFSGKHEPGSWVNFSTLLDHVLEFMKANRRIGEFRRQNKTDMEIKMFWMQKFDEIKDPKRDIHVKHPATSEEKPQLVWHNGRWVITRSNHY